MNQKSTSRFAIILFLIGLMVSVQYNTFNKPDTRDTRDIWEIRQAVAREMQTHSELLSDIRALDETIVSYSEATDDSPERILQDTVSDLRAQAGVAEWTGPGIEVTIEPSAEAVAFGFDIERISPDLLIRFMNEINRFNGLHTSIDGKRVIATTAIRDINGQTTVNGLPVQTPPFNVKIGTSSADQAEKLYNHLLGSPILDDFFVDNLSVSVSDVEEALTVEAYSGEIAIHHLQPAEEES